MPSDYGPDEKNRGRTTALRVEDILQLAARDEDNAASIHRALARIIPAHSEQFGYMAVQEQNHQLVVEQLLGMVAGDRCASTLPPQSEKYLSALLYTRAADTPDAMPDLAMIAQGPTDALRLAIQVEKDALLLYLELREQLAEGTVKGLGTIVREEHDHISDLAAFLRSLEQR